MEESKLETARFQNMRKNNKRNKLLKFNKVESWYTRILELSKLTVEDAPSVL